jgi:Effector-associated domain 1
MHFLDRPAFAASDPDGRELLKAVIQIYGTSPPVQALVRRAGLPLSVVSWDRPMEDVWPELLEKAALKRRLRRLAELVADDNPAMDIFRQLTAPVAELCSVQPWSGCLFGGRRRPFIDRAEFRRHLPVLLEPDGARVLTVNGPRDSGRSYSWHLIAHVSQASGEYEAYRVDLDDWAGTQVTPADLMREIASQLGWPAPDIDPMAQEDTQVRTLLSWFKNRMRVKREICWLVIDSLDAERATEPALRLVDGIACAAERHEAGNLRVVLLAYARPLPGDVDPFILRDQFGPIGIPEIRAFFMSVATETGQPAEAAALDTLVDTLLGTPPPPGPLPLGAVAPLAAKLAREAFYPTGPGL